MTKLIVAFRNFANTLKSKIKSEESKEIWTEKKKNRTRSLTEANVIFTVKGREDSHIGTTFSAVPHKRYYR
jgi:hypothetical protein